MDDEQPVFRDPPPPPTAKGRYDWQQIGNADVLVPKDIPFPLGVVHFAGGAGVGAFPRNAYGTLLEALVDAGETCHGSLCCGYRRLLPIAK